MAVPFFVSVSIILKNCVLYNVLTNVGFMFKTYELFIYHLALWNTISSEKRTILLKNKNLTFFVRINLFGTGIL